jgi:3-hydroxyisobutyrate dehydrogenase-like beta-hydroxyacid dehydrogenase
MTAAVGRLDVGFVGLAQAGFALHAWARRPASIAGLRDEPHHRHGAIEELAAACDVVGLCVSTDEDVLHLVTGSLLPALRPGSVVVNHGTGTPATARRLAEICAPAGVEVLDAPVSGGRPAAEERRLTTMVGGPHAVAERCEPVFSSFSRHVVHMGEAGAGQTAKLFNNALLMMNQAGIAEIVDVAVLAGVDPVRLVEVLKLGSGSSAALTLLNTMVTLDTVEHLSGVEALDMDLFEAAMQDIGVDAGAVTARGMTGARRLPELLRRLNP